MGYAARLQLAQYLVALRDRAGLTLEAVAKEAGCGKSTVARYETWQDRGARTVPTVRSIAGACQAKPKEIAALVELVRAPADGSWIDDPAVPAWMDPLLSIERAAAYEHVYASGLVPGLLQTRAYAMATYTASEVRVEPEEVERKVCTRLERQEAIHRSDLHLWVVLDESVLRREVGGPLVMAEQIGHLHAMAQRPNVDVQVLPFHGGASAAGGGGHFVILGRDDEQQPMNTMAVVYLEMHRRGVYLDNPEDLSSYKLTFAYLCSQAIDPAASLEMLAKMSKEYSR
ncbi:helix-turn-helix domain-containing protein [Streptomyces sp. NPDC018045]|uniref:helix-turn-helix domain-containing protein n=1 Tax=Streptomyces sp. NPDC018045 TaxID=3365037 RepID=UPI0037A31441